MVSLGLVKMGRRMFKSHSVEGSEGGGAMDKVKKILRSPVTRRKTASAKYFGVSLEEILKKENTVIPCLVTSSITFICDRGLDQEGLFRVNGNSRVVDKLRAEYDRGSTPDLEQDVDVASVAGLLKLYLRELPHGIVGSAATRDFVRAQDECGADTEQLLARLALLLDGLSAHARRLLRYLCAFLCLVARHEDRNKMGVTALSIVFGPNIFRCQEGIGGLREQGVTNHVTAVLLKNYDQLLGADHQDDGGIQRELDQLRRGSGDGRVPPPRPPPPQLGLPRSSSAGAAAGVTSQTLTAPALTSQSHLSVVSPVLSPGVPVPSPRKKAPAPLPPPLSLGDDVHGVTATSRAVSDVTGSRGVSDEETLDTHRSGSPSVLDTDRSEGISSPRMTAVQHESVAQVISSVVSRHVFGEAAGGATSSDESPIGGAAAVTSSGPDVTSPVPGGYSIGAANGHFGYHNTGYADTRTGGLTGTGYTGGLMTVGAAAAGAASAADDVTHTAEQPVPAPRRKRREHDVMDTCESDAASTRTVLERIQQFEAPDSPPDDVIAGQPISGSPADRQRRQRPQSAAFQVFESSGIVIGMAPSNKSIRKAVEERDHDEKPHPKPRSPKKRNLTAESEDGAESLHSIDSIGLSADSLTSTLTQKEFGFSSDDSGFSTIQKNSGGPLLPFKRAPGPKNRRNPSKQTLRWSQDLDVTPDVTLDHIEEYDDVTRDPRRGPITDAFARTAEDVNHNDTKMAANAEFGFMRLHDPHARSVARTPVAAAAAAVSTERSLPAAPDTYIPPLDLSILHEHGDGNVPILADMGNPKTKDAVLSPGLSQTQNTPNAVDDTELPPSTHTDPIQFGNSREAEERIAQVKQLTRKIQTCKRKIRHFEEDFELQNGYRPSQTDKAARPEIKKYIQDLAKARKDLKRCKELNEDLGGGYTPWSPWTSEEGNEGAPEHEESLASPQSPLGPLQLTLQSLLTRLEEKRATAGRPEQLRLMTRQQVSEEKLAVQKALLHYEGLHGRPATRTEKELMRPLYDRYRAIKRQVATGTEETTELQSVPEDRAMEFSPHLQQGVGNQVIRVPTGGAAAADTDDTDHFLVTRDMSAHTLKPSPDLEQVPDTGGGSALPAHLASDDHLHQMNRRQLQDELGLARQEKKQLRRVLRDFEDNFSRNTGRKVTKDDRAPMETEYNMYKHIKARLKLLDALLSKHDSPEHP